MIRRPPRSTQSRSSAASDVYKRQPDFVRWGTRLGCLEMLLGGTTTFTDMYYFEDVVAEAAKEAGMRGVLGETIIGFPVADNKTPADALAYTERFLARFQNDALITACLLYTSPS